MDGKQNFRGYTLIELLVGLSIMVIVFTVGFAGYRDFSRRQNLAGIAKNLKADLRSLQQIALIGQKPEGLSCVTLNGYVFRRVSSSSYTLNASCINSLGSVVEYQTKTVDLSTNNISISATTPAITFKVLGHGTDLVATNTITLTQSLTGNIVAINVGVGGEVE